MRPWTTDSHTPSHAPLARGYNCQAAMPLFKTANWLFHLSHPSTLFSQPFLCLPLFAELAEQIGGVAQRAEGVAESLRSSETQLLSVCFHRKAVSAEWNISLNTILSTLNTFTTPPGLRPTSPINCAPLREQGRTPLLPLPYYPITLRQRLLDYNLYHKDIDPRQRRHCGSATAMRPWATDSHTPSRAPLARGYNCQAVMPLFKTANWLFHLSHPSTLFSQPFLCLPLFA